MLTLYFFNYLTMGLLGLCVGSFLNVVVHRLPIMLQCEWQDHYNLCVPRSHCPHCKFPIPILHNIPVLSYLFLKGHCSSCQQKISIRYPLIEVSCALLTLYLAIHFGINGQGVAALLFTWGLLCLTAIDFDQQLLPDNLTLPLLWVGLICSLFEYWTNSHDAIIGAIAGYIGLWSLARLFYAVTGKVGMGHGDFKLLALLGAWLGWPILPIVILLASSMGAFVGITLILFKGYRRDTPIPFGPYLALSGWIALIWGHELMQLYLGLF